MSLGEVAIRPAEEDDLDAVLMLSPRLTEGVAPWRDPLEVAGATQGWLRDSWAVAQAGQGAMFVAATTDGRVIGVASVGERRHFTGEVDAYLGELAVAPQFARQGVGRRLVAAAEEWARTRGLRRLTLETGAANEGARRFYATIGFRDEDVRLTRLLEEPGTHQGA